MNRHTGQVLASILALTVALSACQSSPMQTTSSGPPKATLQFMDWSVFDQELAASLSAPLPKVEVTFYDKVTPSAMPDRLQNWLVSVQSGGGAVKDSRVKAAIGTRHRPHASDSKSLEDARPSAAVPSGNALCGSAAGRAEVAPDE